MAGVNLLRKKDLVGLEFSLQNRWNESKCANCGGQLYISYRDGNVPDWNDDKRHYAPLRPATSRYFYLCVSCAKKFGVAS
jgi:DNA-directed RNA polymerase subunit RPC12/RpoP